MKALNRKSTDIINDYPVKVIQFGEGNFLRAFVNWIIDILNEKTDFNGHVHVVQPIAEGMIDLLNKQGGLYHVLLQGLRNGKTIDEVRLIKCISSASNPYEDYNTFLKLAENPDLEFIISNTTEAGISFKESDKDMDALPDSFPGKLTALLYHRFEHFEGAVDKGLILIPCELIEKNGVALKKMILKYAAHWHLPAAFITWVENHNSFCNTLVDRIVPGFPKENIKEIQEDLGYEDNLVVKAEPFHLWVIDGPEAVKKALPTAETDLDVLFVNDITPYRTRKVRILNGAHTSLVPVAYLNGLRTVREAVEDDKTGKFIKEVIYNEIVPTLDLPKKKLEAFAEDVLERFKNPFIHHELISIALNSISKYKVRVLPSLLEYHKRTGDLPEKLVYSLAALIVFYKGTWNNEKIPLNDSPEVLALFEKAWQKDNISSLCINILTNTDLWGMNLTLIEGLKALVEKDIYKILKKEKQNSY